jgi:ABC-type transport system involved in multi-copper enzyme maturation permease subunit
MSQEASGGASSPLNDLSYRHYSGPLEPPTMRWWVISKLMIRQCLARRGFIGWSLCSTWFFAVLMMIFWFFQNNVATSEMAPQDNPMFKQVLWRDNFLHGFGFGQLFYFILTLFVGVGAVANDTLSKATLIYFSKPLRKWDYIFGKWFGIFLPLFVVMLVPALLFYFYCLMSFMDYGFKRDALFEFWKFPLVAAFGAAVYASIALLVSSVCSEGRTAGAIFSMVYFVSLLFTVIARGISGALSRRDSEVPGFFADLQLLSVDGISLGFAKLMYKTQGSFPFPATRGGNVDLVYLAPHWAPTLILFAAIVGLGFGVAWLRVRAVEVVK